MTSAKFRRLAVAGSVLIGIHAVAAPRRIAAQSPDTSARASMLEATAGSEIERYLRVLQDVGTVPLYPWSLRGFSPAELDRLTPTAPNPWSGILRPPAKSGSLTILPPKVQGIYNSTFPYGMNDGPIWAGRGATFAIDAGIVWREGPVSLTLDPTYFIAQNASFPLVPTSAGSPFGDPFIWGIDLPQRFGNGSYSRVDPGQSTLRVDIRGFAAGVSTADEIWGPAVTSPLILSNNAPGFPHLFLGTAHPVNIGIGSVHGRVDVGRLDQSAYSPVSFDTTGHRLMAGTVITFTPRGMPGLELGGSRFFHRPWQNRGSILADFAIPFQGLLSTDINYDKKYDPGNPEYTPENQLASLFFRWVFPRSGVEVYGEFARNDRNYDWRDLAVEPDHDDAYTLGMQRVWGDSSHSHFVVLSGELTDGEMSHLERVRDQADMYQHTPLVQGHTNIGQVLGAATIANGGGDGTVSLDWYRPGLHASLSWMRWVVAKPLTEGAPENDWDVTNILTPSVFLLRSGWEFGAGLSFQRELNRNFQGSANNLGMNLTVRRSALSF